MTNLQRFRLLRIALVLCGAAIVLICASISWGQNFILQPAAQSSGGLETPRGNRLVYAADLRQPGINGLTIRYRRHWPPQFIDQCRARVKEAGDQWTLLVCSEPRTWYPPYYMAEWETLIADLGVKYAADPSLAFIHLTGVAPNASEERHHQLTPELEAADKRLISAWIRAFPGKRFLFAIGNKDDAGMKRLIQYAMMLAPGRVVVKHNSLKASTNLSANHNRLVEWAGKQGAGVGFELVGSTLESRTGSLQGAYDKGKEVARRAGKPISYIAWYPPDAAKVGGLR
jgi:hypothetical protein